MDPAATIYPQQKMDLRIHPPTETRQSEVICRVATHQEVACFNSKGILNYALLQRPGSVTESMSLVGAIHELPLCFF